MNSWNPEKQNIILLIGNAGSGKDTAAEIISTDLVSCGTTWTIIREYKFAYPIKSAVAAFHGVPSSQVEDRQWKDANRKFFRDLGDIAKESYGEEIFVQLFFKNTYRAHNHFVITDCRFPVEIDVVERESLARNYNLILIGLQRDSSPDQKGVPSEQCEQLCADRFIPMIRNNGTLEELYKNLKDVLFPPPSEDPQLLMNF